jgi:hypothetical protein
MKESVVKMIVGDVNVKQWESVQKWLSLMLEDPASKCLIGGLDQIVDDQHTP